MVKTNNEFLNIAILGIGNIGVRHLESIIKTSLKINIFIFDIHENRSKEVISNYQPLKSNINIQAIKNIKYLPDEVTFCIISTPALQRLNILKQIDSNIKFLLLEKVLTSSKKELKVYKSISKKFEAVYVNMPYYYQNIFQLINKYISKPNKIIFKGGNFGIACNLVHFLDISEKLFQKKISAFNQKNNNLLWKKSSREGFYDLTGEILVELSSGEKVYIISEVKPNNYLKIIVSDELNELMYDLSSGELFKNNTFCCKNIIPYQSSRTLNILEDLLTGKSPKVSSLDNAIRIHNHLINILQPSWNKFYEINCEFNNNLNEEMLIT